MQLHGMASEPVRVSLDATWWPADDLYSHSARLWIRSDYSGTWEMQEMSASGLYPRHEVSTNVMAWAAVWSAFLTELGRENEAHRGRR